LKQSIALWLRRDQLDDKIIILFLGKQDTFTGDKVKKKETHQGLSNIGHHDDIIIEITNPTLK
jgi:hypothetical protein